MTGDPDQQPSGLPPPGAYRERPSSGGLRWAGLAPIPAPRPVEAHRPVAGKPSTDGPLLGSGFGRNSVFVGFAWALIAFLVIQFVGLGILLASDPDPSDRTELLTSLIATLVIDGVAFLIIPVWVLRGRALAFPALGLRRPSWRTVRWGFIALSVAYAVLGMYLGMIDVLGIERLDPVSTIDDDEIYSSVVLVALTGFLAVIVAPVLEEVFYRGFLVGGLTRRFGLLVAVVGSSLLFAAVHLDVGSLIPFALIGLVFAWVYVRSGNLWSAIIGHFLFNAIAFAGTVAERGVG